MSVKPIPEGHQRVVPHLTVSDAAGAIEFYIRAFGANEIYRSAAPDGKILHAELRIGDTVLFLNDPFDPAAPAAAGFVLNLWVEDADAAWERAVAAGAAIKMPLANQFWGDRYGKLTDPFGITWAISSQVEQVEPEELVRRAAAFFSKMS